MTQRLLTNEMKSSEIQRYHGPEWSRVGLDGWSVVIPSLIRDRYIPYKAHMQNVLNTCETLHLDDQEPGFWSLPGSLDCHRMILYRRKGYIYIEHIHTQTHTHTHIHTNIQTYRQTDRQTYITYITYITLHYIILLYITYIHTYLHNIT